MSALELKFINVGKWQHIAFKDPRNPHLRIWYPGCHRIPLNVFGSVLTDIIDNAADQPTKSLCQSCTHRISVSEAG